MTIDYSAKTDIGRIRKRNEDAIGTVSELGLYVVADGMGGHNGGERASNLAIDAIIETVRARRRIIESWEMGPTPGQRIEMMRLGAEAVRSANDKIVLEADQNMDLQGMGTTAVVAIVAGDRAFITHVGDSRAYLLRERKTTLLTEDHSLLFELLRQGRLSREASGDFPLRNVVTKALGTRGVVESDTIDLDLLPGDRLVLCSDGLSGYVSDDMLIRLAGDGDAKTATDRLISFANAAGGGDNISAIVVVVKSIDKDPREVLNRIEEERSHAVFSGLPFGDWVRLVSTAEHRVYRAGQAVFKENYAGDGLFIVQSGEVELRRGDKVVRKITGSGIMGEMSLLEDRPHLVTAVATKDSEILVFSRRRLELLNEKAPIVALKIHRQLALTLSRRLRDCGDELVVLRTFVENEKIVAPGFLSSDDLEEDL